MVIRTINSTTSSNQFKKVERVNDSNLTKDFYTIKLTNIHLGVYVFLEARYVKLFSMIIMI